MKLFRLLSVLWENEEDHQKTNVKKDRWIFCISLFLAAVYFFLISHIYVSQRVVIWLISALFMLQISGLGLLFCLKGILPAVDSSGGKLVMALGCVAVGAHAALTASVWYGKEQPFLYLDIALMAAVFYYLFCNGAWLIWEHYKKAQKEHHDLKKVKMKYGWQCAGIFTVFSCLLIMPTLRNVVVYSRQEVEQTSKEAVSLVPEYEAYTALVQAWNQPEQYGKLFVRTLEPMFFQEKPVYEDGAELFLKTETVQMSVLFHMTEDGAELIQSNYRDLTREDDQKSQYQFINGNWYSLEECRIRQEEAGFTAAEIQTYEYGTDRTTVAGEHPEAVAEIQKEIVEDMTRYRLIYDREYLKQQRNTLLAMGIDTGEPIARWESFLADKQGHPIEYTSHRENLKTEYINLKKHTEQAVEEFSCRYVTTDQKELEKLITQMIEQGPFVPEEVTELYQEMICPATHCSK